nr:hypothetical protein [Prevotella sp.]
MSWKLKKALSKENSTAQSPSWRSLMNASHCGRLRPLLFSV